MSNQNQVELPPRHIFITPTFLRTDAYTLASDIFTTQEARDYSEYYGVFRRMLNRQYPEIYKEGDERIVVAGLRRVLERLFYNPSTSSMLESMVDFLSTAKATTNGPAPYEFPAHLIERINNEFNGRPPISIRAMPEGSVIYPHEPFLVVKSEAEGFGEIAAWFEKSILHLYAPTERVTQDQHFLNNTIKPLIREIDPFMDELQVDFFARLQIADFGARAAMNDAEEEDLGMIHFLTYYGSDTVAGAYQAWMDSGKQMGKAISVWAMAHRNVQAATTESEAFQLMYDAAKSGDMLSMVIDAYDSKVAVDRDMVPMALRSLENKDGKIIVGRPDSGEPLDEIMYIIDQAIAAGLYEEREIAGKKWKFPLTLHYIEADGMNYGVIANIMRALMDKGIAFYAWGLFGMGGGLRNNIKRDNLSAKYAMCAVGKDKRGVAKFSETPGKMTLPGPFKVVRTPEALATSTTIRHISEEGEDVMVEYFNGARINKPFGEGQYEDFNAVFTRTNTQFPIMPKTLRTATNNGYPASELLMKMRGDLMAQYAPNKIGNDSY